MLANFQAWIKQPFNAEQSAWDWFLFLGFILIAALIWRVLLNHVLEGLE